MRGQSRISLRCGGGGERNKLKFIMVRGPKRNDGPDGSTSVRSGKREKLAQVQTTSFKASAPLTCSNRAENSV